MSTTNTVHLGVIGAMDMEVDALRVRLQNVSVYTYAGRDFYSGTLHGTPVTLVRCGVGITYAALCAQLLIDHFHVTHVINTGIAGGLDPNLCIGDVVISTNARYHDFSLRDFSGLPEENYLEDIAFEADKPLRELLFNIAKTDEAPFSGTFDVMYGTIASGNQFICTKEQKDRIIAKTGALCTEMEGVGIAQTCVANGVPFVICRSISDGADKKIVVTGNNLLNLMSDRAAFYVERVALALGE